MDDVDQPAPYRCKHDCERDQLKDRIAALRAEVARLREIVYLYVDPCGVRPEHEAVVLETALKAGASHD